VSVLFDFLLSPNHKSNDSIFINHLASFRPPIDSDPRSNSAYGANDGIAHVAFMALRTEEE